MPETSSACRAISWFMCSRLSTYWFSPKILWTVFAAWPNGSSMAKLWSQSCKRYENLPAGKANRASMAANSIAWPFRWAYT